MDKKDTVELWKINTVIKAASILKMFTGKNPKWSYNQLVQETKMPKSTLSNTLKTLEYTRLLEKDAHTQLYHLGLEILEMSYSARKAFSIIEIAMPFLDDLQQKTGEIVYFTVPKDGKVLYLEASYPASKSVAYSVTGKTLNMHCTGVGKAMLSKMSLEDVKKIVDYYGLPRYTSTTITEYEALINELEAIRQRGYAIDNGEEAYGVRCIAAPIVSGDHVIGAISISGSTLSMKDENFDAYASMLMEVANTLAQSADKFPYAPILPPSL